MTLRRLGWTLGLSYALLAGGHAVAEQSGATVGASRQQQPGSGSSAPRQQATAEPGSQVRVFLLTAGPGAAVWEKFGHNALLIVDSVTGQGLAYNYGVFDFAAPDFLVNFVKGRLLYWLDVWPGRETIEHYAAADRTVWMQELNLTPAQRLELTQFLEWNARPENRRYLYDYYRDNCSTRLRDAIDRVLGGELRRLNDRPSGTTFRSHTLRLTADMPVVYTGLELAIGQPIDEPISMWEEMFIPMLLRDRIAEMTVPGPAGERVPLVKSERVVHLASAPPAPDEPPSWTAWYALLGIAIGALFFWAGTRARRGRRARLLLGITGTMWTLIVGVLGAVILFLWVATDHSVTYRNENLLQANPLPLIAAMLLPLWMLGLSRAAPALRWTALLAAGLSVLGFAAQLLPGLDQVNGEIIGLLLPAHVGFAAAMWVATRSRAAPSAS